MRTDTEPRLRFVRAVGDAGHEAVREQLESGRNFFLILATGSDAIARFCLSFDLKADCLPDNFTRSDLIRMAQYIESSDFDEMLAAWDNGERVVFLEQLDFPMTRPPLVKPFLLYSPVWGILSQHNELMGAKRAREESEDFEDRSRLAQPSIYHWDRGKWRML